MIRKDLVLHAVLNPSRSWNWGYQPAVAQAQGEGAEREAIHPALICLNKILTLAFNT